MVHSNLNNLENGKFLKKLLLIYNLISGKKKYSKKKIHYYIGKAERKLLSDRLNDRNHHINDFSSINEVWIGTIINKKAMHRDVMLIKKC